ncbi:hypothetical protein H2200_008142 [Cladophialophora chaetospira]|uniref:Uncharacterized protein n=1 Tax=Cladophialophora chaetospira TaxID=386627 RepID=A0AA38X574_9EURO|nr:hypothetical protein H2200_008142 [Cladophialophora chaetospira]
MTKRGGQRAQGGDVGRKERPGGIQLPMEVSFIAVNKPGERIPYSQLSQITAHAMRKSHERRRDRETTTRQGRQPQQAAWSTNKNDQSQAHGSWNHLSHGNSKHQQSQMGVFSKQELPGDSILEGKDGTHSEVQTPSEDSSSCVILPLRPLTKRCDCFHCRIRALSRPSATSDMVFGGSRSDPFLQYPIRFRPYFPAVVDHCKEVIAPDAAFFQLVMTQDVLFEAILSWVLYTTLAHTPELEEAALLHYGATLAKLYQIWVEYAYVNLPLLDQSIADLLPKAYRGDDASFNVHRKALEYLAEFHVAEDLPKLGSIPKRPTKLHDALSSARSWPRPGGSSFSDDDFKNTTGIIPKTTEPIYPTCPFTGDVSKHLPNLPEGFRDLAIKGILSVQVIERVGMNRSQIVRLASRATIDREHSKVLRQRFTPLDHLIWMGFSAFHLCTATYRADREELAEAFIECSKLMIRTSEAENDCLLWGGCMCVTTQAIDKWDLPQRQAALDILVSRFKMSIDEMTTLAHKFLWNESMSAGLARVMQQRTGAVPKIEEGTDWRTFL